MEQRDYYLNALSMILMALAPILIAYGVFTSEQAELWVNLILAIAAFVVPIVIGQTVQNWTKEQARVRIAELTARAQ